MKIKQLISFEFPTDSDAIAALVTDRFSIVVPQEFNLNPPARIDPELDMLPPCGGMFDIYRIDLRLRQAGSKWRLCVESYNLPTYLTIEDALDRECDTGITERLQQAGYYSPPPIDIRGTYLEILFEAIATTHESFGLEINKLFVDLLLDSDRRTEVEGDFLIATSSMIFVGFVNQAGYHSVICPKALGRVIWSDWQAPMKQLVDRYQLEDRSDDLREFKNKRDILARSVRNGYRCWQIVSGHT